MSEADVDLPVGDAGADALVAAIEDDPEAVAAFVARLDRVNELLDVLDLAGDALDDDMVRELARTGGTLAESADGLATDGTVRLAATVGENGDDLAAAMETLVELQRTGTLDDLAALGDLVSLGSEALDDEMVRELARTGGALGEVADAAADPETVRGLESLLTAVGEAGEAAHPPERVGLLSLARATRDPETRAGLGYLLALSKALGADLERRS